ncbi:MAG TPA: hypothetical protein VGK21_00950 [Candidatus Angelobacter sp.]
MPIVSPEFKLFLVRMEFPNGFLNIAGPESRFALNNRLSHGLLKRSDLCLYGGNFGLKVTYFSSYLVGFVLNSYYRLIW